MPRYGAIIRSTTELVESGKAHIGVLFMHCEGYSTMCGHATIALGRFLIDTHDLTVFPKRESLLVDFASQTTKLLLHAPCGLVEVTVPILEDGKKADSSRSVSFRSVFSFAAALNLEIEIPSEYRWSELGPRKTVKVDVCYGGTFYTIVSAAALGFEDGLKPGMNGVDVESLKVATASLKKYMMNDNELKKYTVHPKEKDLSFLYSVMVVDDGVGVRADGTAGVETGLCFFADQQIDRSPTGSCVSARMAVAHAKGRLKVGDSWTYNSFVSNGFEGQGSFVGTIEEEVDKKGLGKGIIVRTEGKAWYTAASTFVVEDSDKLGKSGFRLRDLMSVSI
jgi:trans-L-3-hydroxyproline dehydratase